MHSLGTDRARTKSLIPTTGAPERNGLTRMFSGMDRSRSAKIPIKTGRYRSDPRYFGCHGNVAHLGDLGDLSCDIVTGIRYILPIKYIFP